MRFLVVEWLGYKMYLPVPLLSDLQLRTFPEV